MSGQDARPERRDSLLEYFRSLVATPDEPTEEIAADQNGAERPKARFAPSEGDAVTEKDLVLVIWVEVITSAGRLISPEFVVTINK